MIWKFYMIKILGNQQRHSSSKQSRWIDKLAHQQLSLQNLIRKNLIIFKPQTLVTLAIFCFALQIASDRALHSLKTRAFKSSTSSSHSVDKKCGNTTNWKTSLASLKNRWFSAFSYTIYKSQFRLNSKILHSIRWKYMFFHKIPMRIAHAIMLFKMRTRIDHAILLFHRNHTTIVHARIVILQFPRELFIQ